MYLTSDPVDLAALNIVDDSELEIAAIGCPCLYPSCNWAGTSSHPLDISLIVRACSEGGRGQSRSSCRCCGMLPHTIRGAPRAPTATTKSGIIQFLKRPVHALTSKLVYVASSKLRYSMHNSFVSLAQSHR